MDVVPQAGAVPRRQVDPRDAEGVLLTEGGPHQLAEHVRGLPHVDARAQLGVGPDRVEVAEGECPQPAGGREVLHHHLHDHLGPCVGRGGGERRGLDDREVVGGGVDRGGRGEHHVRPAQLGERVEQGQGLGDVVAVVVVGLGHRLRHHDARRHVHGHGDVGVLVEDTLDQGPVRDVTLEEEPPGGELTLPRQEGVEDHRRVTGLLEGTRRGRPDVARAAGDENLHRGTLVARETTERPRASDSPQGLDTSPQQRPNGPKWTED